MKIIVNEDKISTLMTRLLIEYNISDGNADKNPYTKKINASMDALERLLSQEGILAINIENGKEYLVYEIHSLAQTIGKRYCLCRLIKDNQAYGAIYTKPMAMFRLKN